MVGHIKLGTPDELRSYMLPNVQSGRRRSLANPMAAKIGSGAGKYDDQQNWDYWVMDGWQSGAGRRETTEGGYLYGQLETRFKEQLFLPRMVEYYPEWGNTEIAVLTSSYADFAGFDGEIAVGENEAIKKVAVMFEIDSYANWIGLFAFWAKATGIDVRIVLYGNDAPTLTGVTTPAITTTVTLPDGFGYESVAKVDVFSDLSMQVGDTHGFLVIYPVNSSDTLYLPICETAGTSDYAYHAYDGSSWAVATDKYIAYFLDYADDASWVGFAHFGDYIACVRQGQSYQMHVDAASEASDPSAPLGASSSSATTSTADATAVVSAYDKVFVGRGDSTAADSYTSTAGAMESWNARLFAVWNGYLWRSIANDVYYSGDGGTTWTGPIQIGPDGFDVRGMAGMGEYMYVSTDEALYFVGYGDAVYGVMRWEGVSEYNGRGMINHQGDLYIPVGHGLIRFTEGGAVLPIGPDLDEGLPANMQGRITSLLSTNYWLFATVSADNPANRFSSLWAYNDQGWHPVAKFPYNLGAEAMIYNPLNSWLIVGLSTGARALIRVPKESPNATKDTTTTYWPYGYIETNWHYGGLKDLDKDLESVYIFGENITSSRPVKIYWQDDGSTDWELLGTVTSNSAELRWSDYSTRPDTKRFKLLLELRTDDTGETPIVNAVRVKYHNMVADRFRWQLAIKVEDRQEMLDGSRNPYNRDQMKAHLDGLITQTAPVIFEDADGVRYECKVLAADESMNNFEYIGGEKRYDSVYSVTLEQVTNSTYGS